VELSLAAIFLDNAGGEFSPYTMSRLWGTNLYYGAIVRLFTRWVSRTAPVVIRDWEQVFGGKLERIIASAELPRAELKVIDAFAILRSRFVPQDLIGEVQADDTPAHLALRFLGEGYANIEPEFIDVDSFEEAHTLEAASGLTMEAYELPASRWSAVLDTVLKHGGATLRMLGDGRLSYFVWEPILDDDLPDPVVVLQNGTNLHSLSWATGWQDVRNSIRTLKGDGGSPPTTSVTSGSPRQVDTSVDEWGELFADDLTLEFITSDSAVELNGDRIVELQSMPPLILEATAHMDAATWPRFPLERAQVYDDRLGFNGETFLIIGVDALPDGHRVKLSLWDNRSDEETWLICNRSGHKLDDVYRVW